MRLNANPLKISIIGTGYVGLITGLCLSELGHDVICVDINAEKINTINQGKTPIYEMGLNDLLLKHLGKRFFATTNLAEAILSSNITFIAVNTPYIGDKIDLTFVKQVTIQIGTLLRNKSVYHLIVLKSTVIPGTTDDVVRPIIEKTTQKTIGVDVGLCMNPEFMRAGQAVQDGLYPDRIIVGGVDSKSIDFFMQIYRDTPDVKTIKTNNKTAEMIKYTANSLFATMISFANEMAQLCEQIHDVDIIDVMDGVLSDKRFVDGDDGQTCFPGFVEYLKPGCGFGGSCFPKDVSALIAYGASFGLAMNVLKSTIAVNHFQPMLMLAHLAKYYSNLHGLKIGILGLAFKAGTDDIRSSPAINVIEKLVAYDAQVTVYDPIVKTILPDASLQGVIFADSLEELLQCVSVVMLFTAWPEFQRLPQLMQGRYSDLVVIDGRRMLPKQSIAIYSGIGLS